MSISTLPLSYCTNVHPGQTIAEIINGLESYTVPVRKELKEKIAAGLWIPASGIEEINRNPDSLNQLRATLEAGDLACYTLNTFPYGNFHSERVKENVYLPDWTEDSRSDYTIHCARVLADLMPEGVEGSLSTVPLGFKGFDHPDDFIDRCIDQLLKVAVALDELHDETGRVIRLAIEPEPLCVLETTVETIDFFNKLFAVADERQQRDIADRHLGVCYDVCHQAVEFEDVEKSIKDLAEAGIRINKVHITCAIRVESPATRPQALGQLASFAEPRYLHQTFAKQSTGTISVTDLTAELCESPPTEFMESDEWRVHYHVPVNEENIGELKTTRDDLCKALNAVAKLEYAPHLEVETYTWNVLPGAEQVELKQGLQAELIATRELLKGVGS